MRVVVGGILILTLGMLPAVRSEDGLLKGQIRASIEESLPLLVSASRVSAERRKCFTCHNEGLPTLVLVEARVRGFEIDAKHLKGQTEHTVAHLKRGQSNYLKGIGQGGKADTAGSALWALDAAGHPRDDLTDAVVDFLLQRNADTPFWSAQSNRPPSEGSRFTSTFLALRGLDAYGFDEKREVIEKRRIAAREWLIETGAKTTEDHVFRLRGLALAGADSSSIEEAGRALIGLQGKNGSWAQLADLKGDAYATGTALVALQETGRLKGDEKVHERGIRFLIDSQEKDGSWHVISRSRPIQEFYESGFPHGPDQFISCAATAWATLALLHSLP